VNYIGHPYFGATYFIRARERGFDRIDSFLYAAVASAIYEFGVEAIFERPSFQDLIVTPVGGALLGGFVFEPFRNWIKRKPELKWYDHVGLIVTDPIGALNYLADSLLGINGHPGRDPAKRRRVRRVAHTLEVTPQRHRLSL
jgi:hypothetical protein